MSNPIVNMDGVLVYDLTWQNSGLSPVEIQICRNVASQFPDGAYAEFVRQLDTKDRNPRKEPTVSIKDHRDSDGTCIWDHEPWPCPTAKILKEAAELIRNSPELRDLTDDHMGDCNAAADLIDPGL